ncbi:hypothetical protein FXB65_02710 [Aggregatibacter actinomycetemcomitans]|nr:hypothetical protein FXB65_02710 [Aggregatibacter actinomycetemcomitans]
MFFYTKKTPVKSTALLFAKTPQSFTLFKGSGRMRHRFTRETKNHKQVRLKFALFCIVLQYD